MNDKLEMLAAVVDTKNPDSALFCGTVDACIGWLKVRDWKKYDIREAVTDGTDVLLGDYLPYEY
jgi:hypothetical protein